MIYRTSYGELGHCLNCWHDFDSEELWEQDIEKCPDCGEPLYLDDNFNRLIPEDTDFMDLKHEELHLKREALQRRQKLNLQNVE
jgi:DNA-directed RNA polymerase subunit RPC12/RpoP